MRNLVKYVGIGLLVMGLAACDDKDTNATAQARRRTLPLFWVTWVINC